MAITCGNCGNTKAYRTVSGDGWERCDACSDMRGAGVPDVYWDGTPEHGLPDDPQTGQPRIFSSKGEKARFLRENNLVEAGDKVHGSFPTVLGETLERGDAREQAQAALHFVSQMGKDRRRQEYLRIVKEAQAR